ncbi:MAG: four helix bundle protein [Methanobacteriota archaeon]
MPPRNLHDLRIWRESVRLAAQIDNLTSAWPAHRQFGLADQMRRAAVSIAANLAEGEGRTSPKERLRFGSIALGSAHELYTLLAIASESGQMSVEEADGFIPQVDSLIMRLHAFLDARAQMAGSR